MKEVKQAADAPITPERIRDAAARGLIVLARVRCSTETVMRRGTVGAVSECFRDGGSRWIVELNDLHANSVSRVPLSDVVGIEEPRPREVVERVESEPIEYRNLGRIGGSEQFTVEALRGSRRVGLYCGYLRERDDGMVLYIKEPYEAGLPGKVNIAIGALK